jgi:hypothetical protein
MFLPQGIRLDDAQALRSAASHLNATIGHAVAQVDRRHPNGVHLTFVDINTGNPDRGVPHDDQDLYELNRGDRHALCAAKPWLNGIVADRRPEAAGASSDPSIPPATATARQWSSLPVERAGSTGATCSRTSPTRPIRPVPA